VVQHLTHYSKVKGLDPGAGTGRIRMAQKSFIIDCLSLVRRVVRQLANPPKVKDLYCATGNGRKKMSKSLAADCLHPSSATLVEHLTYYPEINQ
jgi:hypothetical protein